MKKYYIKANELRIGNLAIDQLGNIICVTAKYILEQYQSDIAEDDYLKPITLTEEWLLKFGFKRNDNTKVSDSFYWIMFGSSQLHINPDNGVVWIYRNKNIFNNPCLVRHVHQLQNLYFALTGEELDISFN
jgi:hypothetical protein